MFDSSIIKMFDLVEISSTINVNYVSAPPGTVITANGSWTVIGIVVNELMIVKDNIVVKIPTSDVFKIADYSIDIFVGSLLK